jgi:energy-coupling factor transport system permease protein
VGCIGLLAVALDRPESLLVLLLASALPLPFLGVSGPWLRRGAAALLVVVWATMMSQSLFYGLYPRTPLFEIGPVVVVREGVAYGLLQSLRFVAVTLAGLSLVASTTPDRLVPALTWFRIPPGLAFLAVTALRSLPTLAREAVVVRDARRRRGRPVWARAPWAWLALEVAMLRPIVARSLRRARTLAETLDVRGFDPLATRPSTERFALADAAAIVPVAGATLLVVATRLLFTLYTADLLWFPRFAGVYAFVRHHL